MKKILINITCIVLAVLFLAFLQKLFMPKYMSSIYEGNLIEEYYDSDKDHDVIFIGDCEVFSNVSPIVLWEKYGITSYIRGSAQQLVWQSYYLFEETLKYEKPDVVVFNVLAMKYNEPQKEAYNRLTLDGMKLSKSKIDAIRASMLEEESLITYLFPILRYHSRWSELTWEDFRYLFNKRKVSHNGYLMRSDTKPVTVVPEGRKLPDYSFGENAWYYLDKMTKLARENGIELMLIKSPSIYPYWYEEWDEQIAQYAKENDLLYVNFLPLADQMNIDYSKDTYDGGLHMNLAGAEKFTAYLGKILKENYNLEDRRGDTKLAAVWQDKVEFYEWMKQDQAMEMEKYGYLKSYGAAAQAIIN
ncbi:MAG: SGNH/GDSL hydrolase family protein [Caldicoprobacterales bacterium]|nr:SGNH/GDSL hydrolase family protein [Clostridiales bacterium]